MDNNTNCNNNNQNCDCPVNDRERLLKEIMQYDFALADLNLYLDTHPCCQKALSLFNEFKSKSDKLRMMYNQMYGPLTIRDENNGTTWQWVENPWPWERMV